MTPPDDEDLDLKILRVFFYFQQKPDFPYCTQEIKTLLAQARMEVAKNIIKDIGYLFHKQIETEKFSRLELLERIRDELRTKYLKAEGHKGEPTKDSDMIRSKKELDDLLFGKHQDKGDELRISYEPETLRDQDL